MNATNLLENVNSAIIWINPEEIATEIDIEIRLFVATKLHLGGLNYGAYQATLNR